LCQDSREPALPEVDGKPLVAFACSQCHGLRETVILRDGESGWREVVNRMVLYGAQLSPSEANDVTHYLATQLGPHNATAQIGAGLRHSGKLTKVISLPPGRGEELVSTRCALCHDLEKVVSVTRTKADWESVTDNMVQRGMKATPEEVQTMIAYLRANFGT
jgi:hypothetical protein